MKKLFAILLITVMSFSLVACGGGGSNNNDNNKDLDTSYVGTWKGYTNGKVSDELIVSMVLNEDGTGSWTNESGDTKGGNWSVNDNSLKLELSDHSFFEFKIEEENGIIKLNWDNIYVLVPEAEFNK